MLCKLVFNCVDNIITAIAPLQNALNLVLPSMQLKGLWWWCLSRNKGSRASSRRRGRLWGEWFFRTRITLQSMDWTRVTSRRSFRVLSSRSRRLWAPTATACAEAGRAEGRSRMKDPEPEKIGWPDAKATMCSSPRSTCRRARGSRSPWWRPRTVYEWTQRSCSDSDWRN